MFYQEISDDVTPYGASASNQKDVRCIHVTSSSDSISVFKSIMVSKDHMCEVRETSYMFSPDPDMLDTPPFRSYDRGVIQCCPW